MLRLVTPLKCILINHRKNSGLFNEKKKTSTTIRQYILNVVLLADLLFEQNIREGEQHNMSSNYTGYKNSTDDIRHRPLYLFVDRKIMTSIISQSQTLQK